MRSLSRVCFITPDDRDVDKVGEIVETALQAGIRWVQFRRKDTGRRQLYHDALHIRNLTRRFDAVFIVNDYADIALSVEADGLHIGQDDLPLREARKIMGNVIIGVSTHGVAEAEEAMEGGADYIGFGAIYPTGTKDVGQTRGAGAIKEIKAAVSLPVIAIGGITPENAGEVFLTGCDGIAVCAGISSGDIKANVAAFLKGLPDLQGVKIKDR
jgi:thiamine-phosphate pyrophosphorylase